jgi:LPS export ABC transporter protein LptC
MLVTPTPPLSITVRSRRIGSQYVYITKRRKDNTQAYALRSDASFAQSVGEAGRSEFTNPHIVFTDRSGRRLIADAPHAEVSVEERELMLDGGVVAHTSDGMTLKSDTLFYDEVSDQLHGKGHVVVTTPRGERLVGDRIDANLHLSKMRISHDDI